MHDNIILHNSRVLSKTSYMHAPFDGVFIPLDSSVSFSASATSRERYSISERYSGGIAS